MLFIISFINITFEFRTKTFLKDFTSNFYLFFLNFANIFALDFGNKIIRVCLTATINKKLAVSTCRIEIKARKISFARASKRWQKTNSYEQKKIEEFKLNKFGSYAPSPPAKIILIPTSKMIKLKKVSFILSCSKVEHLNKTEIWNKTKVAFLKYLKVNYNKL